MGSIYTNMFHVCTNGVCVCVCVRETHTHGGVCVSQLSFSSTLRPTLEAGSFSDHGLCLLADMLEGFACLCPDSTLGLQRARDLDSGSLAYVVSISPIASHLHLKTMSYIFFQSQDL